VKVTVHNFTELVLNVLNWLMHELYWCIENQTSEATYCRAAGSGTGCWKIEYEWVFCSEIVVFM
jgi:hypothetical protein